jgi:LPS export ABC transporter protein LptC
MKIRNPKSIIVICVYLLLNAGIITFSLKPSPEIDQSVKGTPSLAPEFTEVENLNYFHLKEGIPQMSLSAEQMKSLGEDVAEFVTPRGVYNYQQKNKTIKYDAQNGVYRKNDELLTLWGKVEISSEEANYLADKVNYFFKKDLIVGEGNVKFEGDDLKSKDHVVITSETMRANPDQKISRFKGKVAGTMSRKKKYEGKITFSSAELRLEGETSLAHLEGDVQMRRDGYHITAGKADMYLENYNKSLKYFVLNDDVKLTEKLQTPEGVQERKAFSERLEGFGREQKMILSGAPRVEMGRDVIKGYRITIRENVDLIEVDDAMSDVQVKREKEKKLKE